MSTKALFTLLCLAALFTQSVDGQRVYAQNSVLSTGSWYKIAVKQEGMYKIDVAFLSSVGIPTNALNSASIRLYGNGGGMLPENNALPRPDDLVETTLEMYDGGDGIFSGGDYCIFYAPGPDRWIKDSTNSRFRHTKNLYSDTAFYYLTIGGQGKRMATKVSTASPTHTVSSFNERYFYENDLVNLLNSGKEWYGELFSNTAGGNNSRSFTVDWTGLVLTDPLTLVADLAARNVGTSAGFTAR